MNKQKLSHKTLAIDLHNNIVIVSEQPAREDAKKATNRILDARADHFP